MSPETTVPVMPSVVLYAPVGPLMTNCVPAVSVPPRPMTVLPGGHDVDGQHPARGDGRIVGGREVVGGVDRDRAGAVTLPESTFRLLPDVSVIGPGGVPLSLVTTRPAMSRSLALVVVDRDAAEVGRGRLDGQRRGGVVHEDAAGRVRGRDGRERRGRPRGNRDVGSQGVEAPIAPKAFRFTIGADRLPAIRVMALSAVMAMVPVALTVPASNTTLF